MTRHPVRRLSTFLALVALAVGAGLTPAAAQTITLKGASQFDDNHSFNQTMLKFAELVQKYYGKPVNFVLHRNRELGLEKDYFAYMSQGLSVDYAIVAPSHMATFSKQATLMDMPFLFRDLDHWREVMVRNMEELKSLPIRVMGAPIQTRIFQAITAAPTVIAYDEVYNAIQTGVIQAGENESPGWSQMKWHEVAPDVSLTQHAITIRPLCFSAKTFRKLPKELQDAIVKAGVEAGAYGRDWERREDEKIMEKMKAEGKVRIHPFTERAKLLDLVAPVKVAFAKEAGADKVLEGINAVK
jgi:TRAP-type C4-dicarboxylate transport system substrate-binding protein